MPYLAVLWGSACGGQLLLAMRFTYSCCHETGKGCFLRVTTSITAGKIRHFDMPHALHSSTKLFVSWLGFKV